MARASGATPSGLGLHDRAETPAMRRARRRIDAIDRRIVALLNERTRIGLEIGVAKAADRRPIRDAQREREVLLRVAAANDGPLPQADLLGLYRRLMATTRRLESGARKREREVRRGEREARRREREARRAE
ncbi:MAG: chorismate mutase [Candidatus Limnocylindrales bacterium]